MRATIDDLPEPEGPTSATCQSRAGWGRGAQGGEGGGYFLLTHAAADANCSGGQALLVLAEQVVAGVSSSSKGPLTGRQAGHTTRLRTSSSGVSDKR